MGFFSFVKNMGKNIGPNISKNLSRKYRNFLIMLNNLATDALETASKRAIRKTSEATSDLNGNKIADRITKVSKTLPQNSLEMRIIKKYLKKDIYLQKKGRKLLTN